MHYKKGYTFENDFVKSLREDDNVILADRFLKSIGPQWMPDYENLDRWGNHKPRHAPIDVFWITRNGRVNFAQLKNMKTEQIRPPEMLHLLEFADHCDAGADVWLVSRKNIKGKIHIYKWNLSQIY